MLFYAAHASKLGQADFEVQAAVEARQDNDKSPWTTTASQILNLAMRCAAYHFR